MTAETIHTCSYSCDRPECIRAQRDELAARLTTETSNARGEWVLERLRGVLEHGKMGDKCLIAPDLVTAAIAALSAPAEAQPVAKLVNRKDADGGKTTTFIRPTSLGMDLPLGEYPLHLHPPPSAPVGVEGVRRYLAARDAKPIRGMGPEVIHAIHTGTEWEAELRVSDLRALAQQPAAVDEAMVDRACDAYVQIADDCMGLVRRKAMRAALTAALATQHQEPTT